MSFLNKMGDKKEPEKLKSISSLTSQITLQKLGAFCSERLNIDLYYFMEAVNLLVSEFKEDENFGEIFIREQYKKRGMDWDAVKINIDNLNVRISQCKVWYDPMSNKTFKSVTCKNKTTDEVEMMLQRNFFKYGKKIALMQQELFDIFMFLNYASTIQRQQIKTESFKILEHQGYRTLENKKSPSTGGT